MSKQRNKSRNITQLEAENRDLQKEEAIFAKTFGTPDGKKCLEILRGLFYDQPAYKPDMRRPEVHAVYKSGQREVVGYIMMCIDNFNHPHKEDNKEVKR